MNTARPSTMSRPTASTPAPGKSGPCFFADSNVLLRPGGPLEPVAEWATAFRDAGQKLGHAVQDGTLDRGLRQVLSYHVTFHWNRLSNDTGHPVSAACQFAEAATALAAGRPSGA
ncbi:hypothetical protein [Streptomyces sp. NPDC048669]|uniref:hypothetical protein n=1 Tax=Streptomyces sp. NPDC048669 TaxID=3155267 RepID=UPI00341E2C19